MKSKSLLVLSASICLGLILLGCDSGTPETPSASPVAKRYDYQIAKEIQDKIQKDQRFQGATINVTCDNGTVILSGSVVSKEQLQSAQIIAGGTSGAKNVISRLQLPPVNPSPVGPNNPDKAPK